jgi:hypothetical protein
MKKLLVVTLVLAMASIANAGMIDVVMEGYDDVDQSGTITASDIIYIDIYSNVLLDGYDLDLHVAGPGVLSEHSGGPTANHQTGMMWFYSGIASNGIAQMMDAWLMGSSQVGFLIGGLAIHCEGEGDVLVDLTIGQGATREYGTGYILQEGDLTDLVITQVPEPMTIALLGLGGLFLRRRK